MHKAVDMPEKTFVHLGAGKGLRALARLGVAGERHYCVDVAYPGNRTEKNVEFVKDDAVSFLYGRPDSSIDVIHVDAASWNLPAEEAMPLVHRKLAPGGKLVLMAENAAHLHEPHKWLVDPAYKDKFRFSHRKPTSEEISLSETYSGMRRTGAGKGELGRIPVLRDAYGKVLESIAVLEFEKIG